jgi:opacity protein-like surface antigen
MIRVTLSAALVAAALLPTIPVLAIAQIPVSGGQQNGRVNEAAPVFLLPDATRTPLRTLQAGTTVSVERVQGEWVQIVFNDPQLGRRTGWIQLKFVTLTGPAPPSPPPPPPERTGRPPGGAPPAQARRTVPPPRRQPKPSVRAFGTFGFDKMSADASFNAITGSDTTHGFGGGVQGINLWKGLFAEVNIERSTVDGERAFVFNDEVFPLGIPLKIKTTPVDLVAGWRAGVGGRHPYATYVGGGVTFVSYKETADFAVSGDEVDEQKTGVVALFGVEVTVWKWIHVRGEGRYRRVTDILGNGGVSAAFDENELGGFGGGVKFVVGR